MDKLVKDLRIALLTEHMASDRKLILNQKEKDIDEQIANLKARQAETKEARSKLPTREEGDPTQKRLRDAASAYNCYFYYKWTHNFHQRLPRELRDIIYAYAIPSPLPHAYPYYELFRKMLHTINCPENDVNPVSYATSSYSLRANHIILKPSTVPSQTAHLTTLLETHFHQYNLSPLLDPTRANPQTVKEFIEAHLQTLCLHSTKSTHRYDDTTGSQTCEILIPSLPVLAPFGVSIDIFANLRNLVLIFRIYPNKKQLPLDKDSLRLLHNVRCKTSISVFITGVGYVKWVSNVFRIIDDLSYWYFGMKASGFTIPVIIRMLWGKELHVHRFMGKNMIAYKKWKSTWRDTRRSRTVVSYLERLLKEQTEVGADEEKEEGGGEPEDLVESKFWKTKP